MLVSSNNLVDVWSVGVCVKHLEAILIVTDAI